MSRVTAFVYGVVAYLIFFASFLYAIYFVWNLQNPRPATLAWQQAAAIDLGLLSLFAVQHSVMARQWFKLRWTKVVPSPVERSTYVLIASLILLALCYYWKPLPGFVWEVRHAAGRVILNLVFAGGWIIVLISTSLIDHFELFGLRQVWCYLKNKPLGSPAFATPGFYRWLRHPIYFGFLLAFWSTPAMTRDHLLFAVMTTAYILLAIQFEERDLVRRFGEAYEKYRSGVSMITPWPGKKRQS